MKEGVKDPSYVLGGSVAQHVQVKVLASKCVVFRRCVCVHNLNQVESLYFLTLLFQEE